MATFQEWFNEPESFHLRCERFYDDVEMYKFHCEAGDVDILLKWLQAAYDVGYEQGRLHDSI